MKSGDVKMAATLFVLMGEETASEVLRYLNEAEIEAISKEISYVGPIPAELQQETRFSGALTSNARETEAAAALIKFLASREAAAAIVKAGLAPMAAP